jgi:hypothetical protein
VGCSKGFLEALVLSRFSIHMLQKLVPLPLSLELLIPCYPAPHSSEADVAMQHGHVQPKRLG